MPTLSIFQLRLRFRKSVEYLWRYMCMIFAGAVYRLKLGNFNCCTCAKFSPCNCKSTISARLKLFTQLPANQIFVLRQRFRKWVEYRRRYRIFAGTVNRLKEGNFKCCTCGKFSPWHCKSTISAHLKLASQMSTLNIVELRQRFRKLAECPWRYRIFAATVYRLKEGNFKCFTCGKFSPCHCKSAISAHLKFSTQMPTLKIIELRLRFRKSVEYLWRYRIFAGTLYMLKVAKFQVLSISKDFSLPLQM